MTAVEGNASVYHVYPVGRITGEGRVEFLRTRGPGVDQKGAGGGRGTGGASQFVRGNYKSSKAINLTVLAKMHQSIMGSGVGGVAGRAGQLNLCVDMYDHSFWRIQSGVLFRLGLSMRFSELEFSVK